MKNNYLEKILANRGVLAYFVALAVLFVALIVALDFMLEAHASAEQTEQKIQMMQKATESYDLKKMALEKLTAKPITIDKIDEVQTGILLQIQKNGLSLTSLNAVSASDNKEKNQVFEMDISGSYDNTMTFLGSFRRETKALMAILSVSFRPEKDILKTTIKYKIYVR